MDVVCRSIKAWNENDWAAMEERVDPAITVKAPEGWPESGEFSGWPAVRTQYERLKAAWSDERVEIVDIRSIDEARLLVQLRWIGHGGSSGLAFDSMSWNVYELRDGRITRIEFYFEPEPALRAAGLEN